MRSVLAECREPMRTRPPPPWAMRADPPQDEGAHEDLAELGVPLHERAQMLAIDDDDRPVADAPERARGCGAPTAC